MLKRVIFNIFLVHDHKKGNTIKKAKRTANKMLSDLKIRFISHNIMAWIGNKKVQNHPAQQLCKAPSILLIKQKVQKQQKTV